MPGHDDDRPADFLGLNHHHIGRLWLVGVVLVLLVGTVFGVLLRTEMLGVEEGVVSSAGYRQLFSAHGLFMVFFVAIPAIPAILGHLLLPRLLGAKRMAWPGLSVAAFGLWLAGLLQLVLAALFGRLDAGWTFEMPLCLESGGGLTLAVSAVLTVCASMLCLGCNLLGTVFFERDRSRGWVDQPIFAWSLLVTGAVLVLSTPVLGVALSLLLGQRAGTVELFAVGQAGGPTLFEHLFWFWAHPALAVMILPALGLVSELVASVARRAQLPLDPRPLILSQVAVGGLGFVAWGGHMLGAQSPERAVVFSALILVAAIPYVVHVLSWVRTLIECRLSLDTTTLYALSFIVLFATGGLAGLFLVVLPTAAHLDSTVFAVAQFHYIVVGGTLVALLGGLHEFWSRIFGVTFDEALGRVGCGLTFVGVNLAFFPLFLLGYRGQPRRSVELIEGSGALHTTATIGAWLLAIALLLVLFNLGRSLASGRRQVADAAAGEATA